MDETVSGLTGGRAKLASLDRPSSRKEENCDLELGAWRQLANGAQYDGEASLPQVPDVSPKKLVYARLYYSSLLRQYGIRYHDVLNK